MFGWFKKKTPIKETLKLADEYVQNKATEAAVQAIIREVKEELKKPKHFADCNCFKCEKWRQHAK